MAVAYHGLEESVTPKTDSLCKAKKAHTWLSSHDIIRMGVLPAMMWAVLHTFRHHFDMERKEVERKGEKYH